MSEMKNGKLLKEIHEKVIRLDQWRESVDEKLDVVADIFKPDGAWVKAIKTISNVKVQLGAQWAILILVFTYLIIKQIS